jgi:WD40 repeat protein
MRSTRLASSSNDNSVRVWDVPAGHQKRMLVGHGAQVRVVSFSPDGSTLATASFDKIRRSLPHPPQHLATHPRPV